MAGNRQQDEKIHILVVDRDQLGIGGLISALPPEVETVVTGSVVEALRVGDHGRFDLVVVGLASSGAEQLSVLDDVRVAFPASPVLALVDSDDPLLSEAAIDRGARTSVVRSGLIPSEFAATVAGLLDGADHRLEIVDRAAHVENLLSAVREGIVVQSVSGRVVLATDRVLDMLQVRREELISSDLPGVGIEVRSAAGRVLTPDELPDAVARRSRGAVPAMLLQIRRRDGELRWFETTSSPLTRAGEQEPYAVVTSFRDFTEAQSAHQAISGSDRRERLLLEYAGEGFLLCDGEGRVRESSELVARYWARDSLVGANLADLFVEDDRDELAGLFAEVAADRASPLRAEGRVVDRYGGTRWLELTFSNHLDEPSLSGVVVHLRDATDRKRAEDSAMRLSAILDSSDDAIYSETLEGVITSWNAAAELLYGYPAGEAVGMSALIVTPPERIAGVLEVRERILRPSRVVIDRTVRRRKDASEVEVSIVAVPLFDASGTLIGSATTARPTTPAAEVPERDGADQRSDLEREIQFALERDELRVYYQPILTVGGADLVGVEALVRWCHPHRGLLSPAEFIPVAEKTGLIDAIGSFVLETALAQIVDWRKTLPGCEQLWVSVNLSSRELLLSNPVTTCLWALAATGAPADALRLELKETAVMQEIETSISRLADLRSIGIKVAIDDFGTGNTSLSYLDRLPIRSLKVDQSFIDDIGSEHSAAIVDSIVSLARALHLELCAEGIESQDQRLALFRLGCEYGQGYLWSRPLSAERFADWVVSTLSTRSA